MTYHPKEFEPDALCYCGDILDEHDDEGECSASGCDCTEFDFDEDGTGGLQG